MHTSLALLQDGSPGIAEGSSTARAGYPLCLDDGAVVAHSEQFDEALCDAVNVAVGLVRSPLSLAFLLEAAGAVALERCGAILDERGADAEAGAVS